MVCFNGSKPEWPLLLENGAWIDMQEKNYRLSALIIASENDQTEVVKLLLENGAQVDMQSK